MLIIFNMNLNNANTEFKEIYLSKNLFYVISLKEL